MQSFLSRHRVSRRQRGFTLIELMIVIAIIAIIAAVAQPNLLRARAAANEASAISSLRTISTAQSLYREGDKDGDMQDDYATDLTGLSDAGYIDDVLGSGQKNGYVYDLSSITMPAPAWSATAYPADEDAGRRCFYVDETGVIRVGPPCPADNSSPTLDEANDQSATPDKNVVKLLKRFMPAAILDATLVGLDTNQDQALSFDEMLAADPLGLARDIITQLYPNAPDGGVIASDAHLEAICQEYLDTAESDLELGVANEDVPGLLPVPLKVLGRSKAIHTLHD